MEQSDTVQMHILQVEEIPTDINVQTIHVDEDLKAATSTEGGQDSPKACRPASESTLADDTDIKAEVAAEDYLDASHIEVSVKDIDSDAGYNNQSMEATKALLRHSLRKKLDAALESETYLLIQHWCSVECQTAIKAYIEGKIQ